MGSLEYKILVKGKLKLMIGDKEKSTAALIAPIKRKSKILRASSLRKTLDNLPIAVKNGIHFLDDEEAIAVKRVATSKYLDFPNVLRAGSAEGIIPFGSSLDGSAVDGFLSTMPHEVVVVFLEPWLLRGAAMMSAALLSCNFWEILQSCDYTLKIYDLDLTKSCILSADEDENELRFAVAN